MQFQGALNTLEQDKTNSCGGDSNSSESLLFICLQTAPSFSYYLLQCRIHTSHLFSLCCSIRMDVPVMCPGDQAQFGSYCCCYGVVLESICFCLGCQRRQMLRGWFCFKVIDYAEHGDQLTVHLFSDLQRLLQKLVLVFPFSVVYRRIHHAV